MTRVHIVPATRAHVMALSDRLRENDRIEIAAQGLGPYTVLLRSFQGSLWARTAFVDGEIAAMFGIGGQALGEVGEPWLLTGTQVERIPVAFVKESRRVVAEMLELKPILANYVLASYRGACRLLEVLGFTLGEPMPFGPSGVLFRRFSMSR